MRRGLFLGRGRAHLIHFLHQTSFSACRIILGNNAFLGGFVQRTQSLLDRGLCCGHFAFVNGSNGLFDLSTGGRPNDTIPGTSAGAIPDCLFGGVFVSQLRILQK
jgi:hypothetical protein